MATEKAAADREIGDPCGTHLTTAIKRKASGSEVEEESHTALPHLTEPKQQSKEKGHHAGRYLVFFRTLQSVGKQIFIRGIIAHIFFCFKTLFILFLRLLQMSEICEILWSSFICPCLTFYIYIPQYCKH